MIAASVFADCKSQHKSRVGRRIWTLKIRVAGVVKSMVKFGNENDGWRLPREVKKLRHLWMGFNPSARNK